MLRTGSRLVKACVFAPLQACATRNIFSGVSFKAGIVEREISRMHADDRVVVTRHALMHCLYAHCPLSPGVLPDP